MTYQNRMKKVRSKKCTWWPKKFQKIYADENTSHQMPYFTTGFRDSVNPNTGSYNGWKDCNFKNRSLKKRVRTYSKQLISSILIDMENDKD